MRECCCYGCMEAWKHGCVNYRCVDVVIMNVWKYECVNIIAMDINVLKFVYIRVNVCYCINT